MGAEWNHKLAKAKSLTGFKKDGCILQHWASRQWLSFDALSVMKILR